MGPYPLIGIFGGTFDPIHSGHLHVLAEIGKMLSPDLLLLIPAATPPHRTSPRATIEQRMAMIAKAVQAMPSVTVDSREIRRGGTSYSVDTLTSLREDYPQSSLCLILGYDAYRGLPTWHRWQDLPRLCNLLVVTRPGWRRRRPADWMTWRVLERGEQLRNYRCGAVFYGSISPLDVSSTAIRDALHQGREVKPGWLPETVESYIRNQDIYGGLQAQS